MSYVDLHVHSNASDGTLSPEQVVRLAHEAGLSAIALTDHDTTAGVAGAAEAGAELGLEVVPGIEVSSSFRDHEIHILGLFVDTDSPSLQAALKEFRHHRDQRNQEMLGRFDAHGIHLTAEDLCAGNPDTVITRAHVARALLAKGLGPDLDHIFKKYLQYGGTYCPPKEFLPPEAVMEALLDSHAFVALAHPFQYKLGDKATEELIAYLAQFEISPRKAMEVFKAFGVGAMQAIASNPYLLCGEPLQLDFRHADSIAQYYHMEGDCAQRLEAALLRTLRHNAGNGHTCLPRAQLLATASNFIHQPPEKLARALDHCIETEELAVKMFDAVPYIYLPDLLAAEQDIADRLNLLAKRGKNTVRELDKNIQILELTQGFAYAPLQREAIRKAMTENCLVLTGGPGTGKTTTVNAILQLLENQAERVALCAPTGRAAKRLSELTGRKASTIHRLLEVDYTGGVVSFIHNDKNLLKCDVVILDEMSMVDVKLFQALIAALRYTCRIIMVGDADQLPSVGAGNILSEVIHSGCVPTVCLNEIFRQAKRSLIVENAHHIISGEPLQKGSKTDDFFFLETDGEAAQRLVCDLVTTRLPRSYGFDPIRDIQVLCPTKLGPTGTQALNVELQNLLNPPQKGKPQLQSAARVFRVGDKVMQVRNNYEIVWNRIGGEQGVGAYNGDIGIVESINLRERSMVVRMDDRRLLYPAENLNELEIAYAITVHKSQGSEFPAVILPAAQVPPRLCYRNLFYTGVTRARRLCVVAGRRDVVNSMMSNIRQNLRYSGLCALLQAGQSPQQLSTEGESP